MVLSGLKRFCLDQWHAKNLEWSYNVINLGVSQFTLSVYSVSFSMGIEEGGKMSHSAMWGGGGGVGVGV